MTFNKTVLAGLVAFAAASTSAQAATVAANDGWEIGVGGLINQFLVFTDNDVDGQEDSAEVRDGLLPAFLNFDVKAPTMNGLDIAAHISISPGTNVSSYGGFEQREVYFTVDGSFGQILAGKALGLYGSHNILTEQTLFGVGYNIPNAVGDALPTTLGGIGLGYDYASWRSQFKWTSPDMNGFKVALAVVDSAGPATSLSGKPTGPLTTGNELGDELRYEADLSYAGSFDGGSYTAWLSAAMQDHEDLAEDAQYWTVGATATFGGFELMAQYSDSEDAYATLDAVTGLELASGEAEWEQFVIQAGYRFAGTTLVSVNYSELSDESSNADKVVRYGDASDDTVERFTVGVYHDVNANLKLVAEYTKVEDDVDTGLDQESYSIGGFVFF
ncbi:MAG: porin [Gammaproteobacteria bacterium]|nr:porin [Gammaproteobacteria bacterium]